MHFIDCASKTAMLLLYYTEININDRRFIFSELIEHFNF